MRELSLTRRLFAWAKLLRLSNSPTAVADVLMGLAVASGGSPPWDVAIWLIVASLGFYHGGMVLNDVVDLEQDRRERPSRPLPSGEISETTARRCAYGLLAAGVSLCALVTFRLEQAWPLLVGIALAAMVMLYNSRWKSSWLGPWLMGGCRVLNGLLGMSVAIASAPLLTIAPGVLLYVAGLTWLARDEAAEARRNHLVRGVSLCTAGLLWLASSAWGFDPIERTALQHDPRLGWLLWGVVALAIGRRQVVALVTPSALHVGRAIVGTIQGLILIDASLAFCYGGPLLGLGILALLPVAMLLALVIPAT